MTDWLGMAAHPRPPRPELKARVVARALASRRRGAWLGAAAVLAFLGGGGGAVWAYRTIGALTGERGPVPAPGGGPAGTPGAVLPGPPPPGGPNPPSDAGR